MEFLGKKPQTLLIPIYSTTILYDTHCAKVIEMWCQLMKPFRFNLQIRGKKWLANLANQIIPQ